jgi:hypothetical protein
MILKKVKAGALGSRLFCVFGIYIRNLLRITAASLYARALASLEIRLSGSCVLDPWSIVAMRNGFTELPVFLGLATKDRSKSPSLIVTAITLAISSPFWISK